MTEPTPLPTALVINCPPDAEEGHYADFASIWHNRDAFIIDFVALVKPPHPGEDDQGGQQIQVDCRVVSRVRLPASQVFEVMKALEKQLSAWEAETGNRPIQPLPIDTE
jgi:hypothetical protein